jgi:adenylosuccinate synthase
MPVDVVVGLQRGDEGKGRFVDMLAEKHDIVARFNGGNNAGHTVVLPDGRDLALHQVPSGIAHEHTVNVIGNGALVNPEKLTDEIRCNQTTRHRSR